MALKCDKCTQEFGSEIALSMHLKDKHGIIDTSETSKSITKSNSFSYKLSSSIAKRKKLFISALVVVVLISSIFFLIPKSVNAQSVDGIQCNALEGTVIHIHPHLNIVYNNVNVTIPAQIGIESSCLYGLHTHDTSGTIHVESPVVANYTLGEFFDVWNKTQPNAYSSTFTQKPILAMFNNSTITTYVSNALYSGNYRNIILKDGEQIKLVIVSR